MTLVSNILQTIKNDFSPEVKMKTATILINKIMKLERSFPPKYWRTTVFISLQNFE